MQSAVGVTFKKLLNYGLCLQNTRTLSGAINSLSQGCQCQSFLQSNSTEKSSHRYVHKLRLARSSAFLSGFQIGRTGHWNVKLCIDGPTGRKVWVRFLSTPEKEAEGDRQRGKSVFIYTSAIVIFMVGMTYAGVPLYRIFCQATGLGGKAVAGHDDGKVETMVPVQNRIIRVRFNADVASSMKWNFRPQQSEVRVFPGETALAFYTAKNPTNKAIIGISTYNVVPFEAGQYFNKIQCFCFEEQRLNPKEEVDMPVFFYIDPEFAEDPKMEKVETITLSYTFFEAKEGLNLPLPGYATQ